MFLELYLSNIVLKLSKILQIRHIYREIIKKQSFFYESTNVPKSVHLKTIILPLYIFLPESLIYNCFFMHRVAILPLKIKKRKIAIRGVGGLDKDVNRHCALEK